MPFRFRQPRLAARLRRRLVIGRLLRTLRVPVRRRRFRQPFLDAALCRADSPGQELRRSLRRRVVVRRRVGFRRTLRRGRRFAVTLRRRVVVVLRRVLRRRLGVNAALARRLRVRAAFFAAALRLADTRLLGAALRVVRRRVVRRRRVVVPAFLRRAARAFFRFRKAAARCLAVCALRLMPVLLLMTELLRFRATLDLSFERKLFRFSRVKAAFARRNRAFDVS